MRELSVAEQRYQAVLAVISDGETVTDVAARFGVRRQTVHEWLPGMRLAVWRTWPIGRIGQHGLIPLLSHTQLPHQGSVRHQPK